LSPTTTLFVGANNSGKTSAMVALNNFLNDSSSFGIKDFTLSNWPIIRKIGADWLAQPSSNSGEIDEWAKVCPTLDIWFEVLDTEIHYVSKLIPTLDWNGGLLGVRLMYQPKKVEELRKEFVNAAKNVAAVRSSTTGKTPSKLWPEDIVDLLEKELHRHFSIQSYTLDPDKLLDPKDGIAYPQVLPENQLAIEGDPVKKIIRFDIIPAQRGFGTGE